MGKITAYECDSCGNTMTGEDRTQRKVSFDGVVKGYYTEDLCPSCVSVPNHVVLKPLRKRGKEEEVPCAPGCEFEPGHLTDHPCGLRSPDLDSDPESADTPGFGRASDAGVGG